MQTKTLVTLLRENHIDIQNFNFINLDIQGAELMALKGLGNYLAHIDYIYTEVNIDELYDGCALLHQLDSYLSDYKFERVNTQMTQHGWGDAFYVKKKLFDSKT